MVRIGPDDLGRSVGWLAARFDADPPWPTWTPTSASWRWAVLLQFAARSGGRDRRRSGDLTLFSSERDICRAFGTTSEFARKP